MSDHPESEAAAVRLTVDDAAGTDDTAGADELRSLRNWLSDVDEVRGGSELSEGPPAPGTLGPVVDGLVVALGPGGAVTALATALVAWMRHRRSDVTLKATRSDGASFEVSAKRVQLLDGAQLRSLVDELAARLETPEQGSGPGGGAGPS